MVASAGADRIPDKIRVQHYAVSIRAFKATRFAVSVVGDAKGVEFPAMVLLESAGGSGTPPRQGPLEGTPSQADTWRFFSLRTIAASESFGPFGRPARDVDLKCSDISAHSSDRPLTIRAGRDTFEIQPGRTNNEQKFAFRTVGQ